MAELDFARGLLSPNTSLTPSQACLLIADDNAFLLNWAKPECHKRLKGRYVKLVLSRIMKQKEAQASLIQIHGIRNIYEKIKVTQKPEQTQSQLPLECAAVCSPVLAGKGQENKYQMPDVVYTLHNVLLENSIGMNE